MVKNNIRGRSFLLVSMPEHGQKTAPCLFVNLFLFFRFFHRNGLKFCDQLFIAVHGDRIIRADLLSVFPEPSHEPGALLVIG